MRQQVTMNLVIFTLTLTVLLATFVVGITAEHSKEVVTVDWETRWPFSLGNNHNANLDLRSERQLQVQFENCERNCFEEFNSSGIYASCGDFFDNSSLAYDCIRRCIIFNRNDANTLFTLDVNLQCLPPPSCSQDNPCSTQEVCAMYNSVRGSPNILVDNGPSSCQLTSCNQLPAEVPRVEDTGPQCIQNCILDFPVTISEDCDAAEEYFVRIQMCFEDCLKRFLLDVFTGSTSPSTIFPPCLSATAYTCSAEEFCIAVSGTNGIDLFPLFTECGQSCAMNCIEYIEIQNSILAALGITGPNIKRDNILDTNIIFVIHIVVTAAAFFIATH